MKHQLKSLSILCVSALLLSACAENSDAPLEATSPSSSPLSVGSSSNSNNVANVDSFISTLYQNIYLRAPDQAGLAHWRGRYLNGEVGGYSLAKALIYFPEVSAARNAALNGGRAERGVWLGRLYGGFLGRSIDAAGETYWLDLLDGGYPLASVEEAILTGNEFSNRLYLLGINY